MVRRLAAVFSLIFVLSAALSAFGLGMEPRSVQAGDTHQLFELAEPDLADERLGAEADPDSPGDHLLSAELSAWPDLADHLPPRPAFEQGLGLPRLGFASARLPWPFLAALQRPPIFSA